MANRWNLFFTILIFSSVVFGYDCPTQNSLAPLQNANCEAIKSNDCKEFYEQFEDSFQVEQGLSCQSSTSNIKGTAITCSGLAAMAGASALNTIAPKTLEAIAKALPVLVKKVGSKLVTHLNIFGSLVLVYDGVSLTVEGLNSDQDCFENIEFKKTKLQYLNLLSENTLKETKTFADPSQQKEISFSSQYLEEKFIQKVSCQRIDELERQQNQKLNAFLGPLIAQGKIKKDPRLKVNLNTEEEDLLTLLAKNSQCLPPDRRLQMLCMIGNSVMGGAQLSKYLSQLRKQLKPTSISTRAVKSTATATETAPSPTLAADEIASTVPKNAAQALPDLAGKTRSQAIEKLTENGFTYKSTTAGGYVQYKHADGSIVWIRTNGEVTRSGPKIKSQEGKSYSPRYNQKGEKISAEDHHTGEFLKEE